MNVLIREQLDTGSGFEEFQDTELQCERLDIGSAPDQQIQLLGRDIKGNALQLTWRNGKLMLRGVGKTSVQVNGQPCRTAELQHGDVIELDGNRLTVIPAPAGFDVALELHRASNSDAANFENAFVTSLAGSGISMRALSWTLAAITLLVSLLLPLASVYWRDAGAEPPAWLPSDALWISGPLHPVHELAAGDDCRSCHQQMFVQVRDKACQECHEEIADHLSHTLLEKHPDNQIRCASCHREHNEPRPTLIIRADSLCTDCHADEQKMEIAPELDIVTGFADKAHPTFRAHLLQPDGVDDSGAAAWKTVLSKIDGASEQSNLKFPHDVHLDPEKVTSKQDDAPLECNSCHQLNSDREHFAPITMERHCAACHELTFDPAFPERQLPHGKPEEVIFTLEGHYLKRLSDPDYKPATVKKRRRPDRKKKRVEVCSEATYQCALQKAARDTDDQFTRQGCVSCHEISVYPERELYQRYAVKPVKLSSDYFPSARFDHGSHRSVKYPDDDKTLSGSEACASCHDAAQSKESSTLLIPDVDRCVRCHRSERERGIVPLQCIGCHAYHPQPSEDAMDPAQQEVDE